MKKLTGIISLIFILSQMSACGEEALEKPLDVGAFAQDESKTDFMDLETSEEGTDPADDTEDEVIENDTSTLDLAEDPIEEDPDDDLLEKPHDGQTIIDMPEYVIDPASDYGSPYDSANQLSNEKLSWYFNRNQNHQPPSAMKKFDIALFDSYYLGNINEKVIYLTFDEGYENGFTAPILDVLKEKNVPAAFFVTKTYITANPELIIRMVEEGHIVGNHTVTHTSMPTQSDEDIVYELEETARAFKELTGKEMPPFFRPPSGEYSARTLALTKSLGYKTIFWSSAYKDWEVDNQPGKAAAYQTVLNDLHNGMIPLLHAVSQSNTEALPDIIDTFRENGYTFLSLHDLP